MSGYVFWLAVLGPGDESALEGALIVLCSWTYPTRSMKLENLDSKALAALNRTPFTAGDETRVAPLGNQVMIVEFKPQGSSVSFAVAGEDVLELEELLNAFAVSCARTLDFEAPSSLTKQAVRSGTLKLSALVDEMITQGKIDHVNGDSALNNIKAMLATIPSKS